MTVYEYRMAALRLMDNDAEFMDVLEKVRARLALPNWKDDEEWPAIATSLLTLTKRLMKEATDVS